MIYVVFLRLSSERAQARKWLDGHQAWIQRGIDEGVFLMAGSLEQGQGGAVLASHTSLAALQARVAEDPFVAHRVVDAEIVPIAPSRTAPRLQALLAQVSA